VVALRKKSWIQETEAKMPQPIRDFRRSFITFDWARALASDGDFCACAQWALIQNETDVICRRFFLEKNEVKVETLSQKGGQLRERI
jgi:hypothetical protein